MKSKLNYITQKGCLKAISSTQITRKKHGNLWKNVKFKFEIQFKRKSDNTHGSD